MNTRARVIRCLQYVGRELLWMTCDIMLRFYGMSQEDFKGWVRFFFPPDFLHYSGTTHPHASQNPGAGRLGDGCNLIEGLYYCVRINYVSQSPTSISTRSTSTSTGGGITTPIPIQSGMVSNCNDFYLVVGEDSCWHICSGP
jgi:hypothetical protein